MDRPLRIITRAEPPTPANCRTVLEANGIAWEGDVDFVFSSRDSSDGRLVDVHIRRLRTKIEADPANPRHILTVRGMGYKLAT